MTFSQTIAFRRDREAACSLNCFNLSMAADNSDHHCKFPEDLLIEIFLRSRVESLLRLKCVCKRWYTLIENPSFTHKHLQFQRLSNKGRLLLGHYLENFNYLLFNDEALADTSYHSLLNIQDPYFPLHIQGPVNGLYCLFNEADRVVIWNPATKKARFLPVPCYSVSVTTFSNIIGFGLNPLNEEDYKVVLLCQEMRDNDPVWDEFIAMVYTLSTDTWRLIDDHHDDSREYYPEYSSLNTTFLNGFYYWWVASFSKILAFDMGNDAFRLIPGPNTCISEDNGSGNNVTLFHDFVALWIVKDNNRGIDVWVMVEDAVWTKKFSTGDVARFVLPGGFWKNDELILITDEYDPLEHPRSQMVLYSAATREIRKFGPVGCCWTFTASVYYESLVSFGRTTEYESIIAFSNAVSDFFRLNYTTFEDEDEDE